MARFIVHVDLDAFYASVEELDHPEWKGLPLIVGPDPQGGRSRGVVLTANYAARRSGVRSAMPISEAWRRCPEARYAPPRFHRYQEMSERVFEILRASARTIEPAGMDEAYLDLSEDVSDFGAAVDRATSVQRRILEETGLSASFGVAASKLVAKIATDFRKPLGLTAVTPGTEVEFLAPLPARKIPGVGPKTEARLTELGITTCAELAAAPASLLSREFGTWGPRLALMAKGIDDSLVETGWERKSLGSETTFLKDEADPKEWEATIRALGDEIGAALKEERKKGRTVTVKIRLTGFETHTRARTLPHATDDGALLGQTGVDLLRDFAPDRPLRLLGLRMTALETLDGHAAQVTLRDWPADVLGEAEPWRPHQRRLDEM